jgi:hypothetical protein
MATWKDGQVVWVQQPGDIQIDDPAPDSDSRESSR